MLDVHIITLWCAFLAKVQKGVARCIPSSYTPMHYRVLLQLQQPGFEEATKNHLAFGLVVRPTDVEFALEGLISAAYVEETSGAPGLYRITSAGKELEQSISCQARAFLAAGIKELNPDQLQLMYSIIHENLSIPGSHYAQHVITPRPGESLPLAAELTALAMVKQVIEQTVKREADLSFTSFRLLLELYPKRYGFAKQMRSRDITRMLHVGRSYVSTESVKLEERQLIRRIPSPDDARGVLFEIAPEGQHLVRQVNEDLMTIYAGLFSATDRDPGRIHQLMKLLVEGFDQALED